jgi:uncharacterized membrane protein
MWDSIFEWLFKFNSSNFSEGEFVLQAGRALYPFIFLALALFAAFIFIYLISNIYTSARSKAISIALKSVALILLCIPLLEPTLLMPDIVPNENFLAVLVDDSASMTIKDGQFGETRQDDAKHILLNEENGLISDLEENFKVRYYSFGDEVTRIDSIEYLTGDGDETNLATALQRVLSDFKGLPLTGVVVLTDGGDNSKDNPQSMVDEFRSRDIPLHILGLGSETFEQERELLDVSYSKGLKKGSGAEISIKTRSWITEEEPAKISIYKGDKLVHSETRILKGESKTDNITFFFEPEDEDAIEYTLQLESLSNEINTDNNAINLLIDTRKDSVRVLYFEGHLRSDFKFIKRALEDDQVVEFTSLARPGANKFYRQGVKSADELRGGFPKSQEELFKYKAIIFGDIEAAYFTLEQLEMIELFVKNRGGGFLMLGAKNSFAEGDYWNTPIDDLLPVIIDPSRKQIIKADFYSPEITAEEDMIKFQPTRAGLEHVILKLAPDFGTNRDMWDQMPKLTHLNLFGGVKPGATVLAEKPSDSGGSAEPILSIQRYGKGRSAALATASTWRWQLLREAKDTRHERFWRQLVRWMVSSSPNNVNINLDDNLYSPGDEVSIRTNVFDEDFVPLDFIQVDGTITDPFGSVSEISFRPDLSEDGEYLSSYIPQDQGVYEINVEAIRDGQVIGKHYQSFLSRTSKEEFFNATLKRKFLENLVEANDGVYYAADELESIPVNVQTRKTSTSVFRNEYLWDMPLLFILALIILSIEWIYRRRKGLP